MSRERGLSVRLKLTLSYAGFLMLAGGLLLAVVWVFLLRYVPPHATYGPNAFFPGRNDLIRAFVPAAAWALVFLLGFGLLGGWVLAGRMLAPLRRITTATGRAAQGDLSHRIQLEGRQDEFRDLADGFDAMLTRIESQVAEQQRFAANASHELRTPLAVTQTLLEVAEKDPDRDERALIARLQSVNSRAIELTEALLTLSRADNRVFARSDVDLSLLAESSFETLLPLAEKRGVVIEVTGEQAFAAGSPALLQQVTTNLLHNAIVHNLSAHGTVHLRTAQHPGEAVLVIENSGDRIGAALSTLLEPFTRGTDRVYSDQAGAGLGLAIVHSVVRAHGGSLELLSPEEGGLRVTVRLPETAKPSVP